MNDDVLADIGLYETEPHNFYAQVVLTLAGPAPLFTHSRLARRVVAGIEACRASVPGTLWAYTVMPDSARLIVGPTRETTLDAFVAETKAHTTHLLLPLIQRADDDTLDAVLRFNPVWGGAIYRVWAAGYHKVVFWNEYRLSNTIYDLQQMPVEAGLVEDASAWPYVWVGGVD